MQKHEQNTEGLQYIYQNQVDRARFQNEMAYEEFEDLSRRTASNKILQDKVFNIAKISKHDEYQRGLGSMVHKKKFGWCCSNENMSNQPPLKLAEELRKPIIRKFKKRKVYSYFIGNIWGADNSINLIKELFFCYVL